MGVLRIKELREERGMKQVELADRMGVTQGTVSEWERETYLPKVRDLPRLAMVLEREISDLFLPLTEEAC